jgi:HlyD family secretion protein
MPAVSFFKKLWQSNLFKWMLGIFVVCIILVYLFIRHKNATTYQFIAVAEGPITEMVSVTGNTTPTQSVSLGFNSSGTIAQIYSFVGRPVSKGMVLAELDTGDLKAQLQQAQANVDMETAKLNSLKAGASPEDIAVSQSALDKANQDLQNLYASVDDISMDSYAKANDAVRTELSQLFGSGEAQNPNLTYSTTDSQAQFEAQMERFSSGVALDKWQAELAKVNQSNSDLETLLGDGVSYLATVRELLNSVSNTLDSTTALDASVLAAYKSNVSVALTEVNTAAKNLNTLSQNIASQKLVITQAQAALALKKAGSTQQDIDAQQANVENAQASVASVRAKFADSQIVASLSGTITQFDAKVGQIAAPGATLVSIISGGAFEVDADVPETDIGKIAAGNSVSMTLDAFPGETFPGNVFYIDPAETVNQGVVDYKIKISFAKADPRMKSGLTANLDIQTKHKDDALQLPQYAILQTDAGNFVKTLSGKITKQIPVTLGIADQNGNVEIISGVAKGEEVINIGLK